MTKRPVEVITSYAARGGIQHFGGCRLDPLVRANQGAKLHHFVGRRWVPRIRLVFAARPCRRTDDDHPRSHSFARALTCGALATGFATGEPHHLEGPYRSARPLELSRKATHAIPTPMHAAAASTKKSTSLACRPGAHSWAISIAPQKLASPIAGIQGRAGYPAPNKIPIDR